MALVNLKKLRVYILIKLEDGAFHNKIELKRELRPFFNLTITQLSRTDELGRKLWDRDVVHQLSWLRKRNLIENEIFNGRVIPARIRITKLGKEILKFCDTYKKMEV